MEERRHDMSWGRRRKAPAPKPPLGPDQPSGGLDPQRDYFRPPSIPTEVVCTHCQGEYDSWKMRWCEELCNDGEVRGFWCCANEQCAGKGFGFDIWPTEPGYIDPEGRDLGLDDETLLEFADDLDWLEDQWAEEDEELDF